VRSVAPGADPAGTVSPASGAWSQWAVIEAGRRSGSG
jgi:hypothetical protein